MGGSVKPAGIDAFHNGLSQRFVELTNIEGLQVSPEDVNWKRTSRGGVKIIFMANGPGAEFCASHRGSHPMSCFPLHAGDYSPVAKLWWSWREEWTPVARETFELIGASFVFFWGFSAGVKAQVFRAEWDDARHRGDSRGQPHWHIDDQILAEGSWVPAARSQNDFSAILTGNDGQLSDYSAIESATTAKTVSIVDVSGMHLYMGGWTNHNDVPKCWQPSLNLEALKLWAARTLHYVQREADGAKEGL